MRQPRERTRRIHGFRLGAAALVDASAWSPDIFLQCRGVSYGLSLCAECGVVSALHERDRG